MFLFDIINAIEQLIRLQTATIGSITAAGGRVAAVMEQEAKRNAPWHDRTGNARRTLEGFSMTDGGTVYVGVCGNMYYSPQLELGFSGRYAVLVPTLDNHVVQLIEEIRAALFA